MLLDRSILSYRFSISLVSNIYDNALAAELSTHAAGQPVCDRGPRGGRLLLRLGAFSSEQMACPHMYRRLPLHGSVSGRTGQHTAWGRSHWHVLAQLNTVSHEHARMRTPKGVRIPLTCLAIEGKSISQIPVAWHTQCMAHIVHGTHSAWHTQYMAHTVHACRGIPASPLHSHFPACRGKVACLASHT